MDEEIVTLGNPIKWSEMLKLTELNNYSELALALKTSISAFKKQYAREDLADKLLLKLNDDDLYFPSEDKISHFVVKDIIQIYLSQGIKTIQYLEPILDSRGELNLLEIEPIEICNLAPTEVIITDHSHSIAFMSVYDSFITLMLTNVHDPFAIVKEYNWDAIVCSDDTKINWYL